MRRQKLLPPSPDCGCDIVFDCLNGWWCCKVNYWVFVMTVFAVYSLIVLIVPCLLVWVPQTWEQRRAQHHRLTEYTPTLHIVWQEDKENWLTFMRYLLEKQEKIENAYCCIQCDPERSQFAVVGLVSDPVSQERRALMISITPGRPSAPGPDSSLPVTTQRCDQWKLKT